MLAPEKVTWPDDGENAVYVEASGDFREADETGEEQTCRDEQRCT